MQEIDKNDKERLISFIETNDLDYSVSNSEIFKFSVTSADNMKFIFYKTDEKYVVVKYNKDKDNDTNSMDIPYEYYDFNNISQVLEQLSLYDNQIPKQYWGYCNSIDFNFIKEKYNDNWADEFISENWILEFSEDYKYNYLVYENSKYKPKLISPYNTLHEVSTINTKEFTTVDKLYFEIHPESCINKSESYILKLLCNNESVLKEYINYRVSTKKGLKILIESILKETKDQD